MRCTNSTTPVVRKRSGSITWSPGTDSALAYIPSQWCLRYFSTARAQQYQSSVLEASKIILSWLVIPIRTREWISADKSFFKLSPSGRISRKVENIVSAAHSLLCCCLTPLVTSHALTSGSFMAALIPTEHITVLTLSKYPINLWNTVVDS